MFSIREKNKKRYYIPEDRVTNPFWAYNPEIKSFGDTYFNFGSHVVSRDNEDYTLFIPYDASEKDIANILKNTRITGRSFFGCEKKIANVITKSKDRKAAVSNLNILMNTRNKSLKASEILKYLEILTEEDFLTEQAVFSLKKAV